MSEKSKSYVNGDERHENAEHQLVLYRLNWLFSESLVHYICSSLKNCELTVCYLDDSTPYLCACISFYANLSNFVFFFSSSHIPNFVHVWAFLQISPSLYIFKLNYVQLCAYISFAANFSIFCTFLGSNMSNSVQIYLLFNILKLK